VPVWNIVVVVGLFSVWVSWVEIYGGRRRSSHSVAKLVYQYFSEEALSWGGFDEWWHVFACLICDCLVQILCDGLLGGWAVHRDTCHDAVDSVEFFFFIGRPGLGRVVVCYPFCKCYVENVVGAFLFRGVRGRGGRHSD